MLAGGARGEGMLAGGARGEGMLVGRTVCVSVCGVLLGRAVRGE
jgi:hypothetical protein